MGEPVDLRDPEAVRAAYLEMLIDWTGSDLKTVYEPFAQQMGYLFLAALSLICGYTVWALVRKWIDASKPPHLPYTVLKPPTTVVMEAEAERKREEEGGRKKRVIAVLGGTGFLGSHVVDELVARGEYYVYVLGRKFRDERTNRNADALIQVDMLDFDGLNHAFQGVDSVINVAAGVPTAYTSVDNIWRTNKLGLENVVKAARESGVKNFVSICAVPIVNRPREPLTRAFLNSFYWGEKFVIAENGKEGMRTCVVSPGTIIGLRSSFIEPVLSGKLTSFPLKENRVTFLPVEYTARAIVNAEQKLASGESEVVGKALPLSGEEGTFQSIFSLSSWPHKISSSSMWVLRLVGKFNFFVASWTGWAPLGADLSPASEHLLDYVEAEVDSSRVYEVLEVGPPPSIEGYVRDMVERYKEREAEKN